ncbi:DUF4410 domain-containing protein [Paraburkholderia nodosa]|uniref:DUF4410 domain-containing protein n=1 Tax=Paraburkholderia nodosa TaxID=392320 RepID=UPI0004B993E8|nr:DUF4410 domain-containing protein [Paraburkholderia nodosa]
MKTKTFHSAALAGLLLALAGCAATKPDVDASHVNDATFTMTLKQGVAEPTIDANGQDVSAAVKAGLIEAFNKQASKDGIAVSTTGVPVRITIEEYSTRSNVARFMLGVLAGRDHIKAQVNVADARYEVEDSAHSAVNGIDVVAEDVGIEAANGVAELAGMPIASEQGAPQSRQ